ncbi:endonuclease/exonuclease/phosphatase family protein [bacterium]|nr:endonuclease/exonuclease/phosphatase family protein [bacterium]
MRKFFYLLLCILLVFSCSPSDSEEEKSDADYDSVVDADNNTDDNDADHDSAVDTDTDDNEPDYDPCDCDDCCVDPCDPNPCTSEVGSDGTCIATGFSTYECRCDLDCEWNGTECNCDIAESYPCDSNPCENDANSDGTCIVIGWEYECGCVDSYVWDETKRECVSFESDPCDPNPCPDGICFAIDLTTYQCNGNTVSVRIVAGNITSGNNQSYDPGHGIRIFQALKPDIALVQEMNYKNNSASDYKNFAQQIVGTNYYAVDSSDYQIPNGVVSRYPITSHGYWKDPNINNRALMWAVVDIPGDKDIFAISVHLHTDPESDQVTAAKLIVDEIAKVKEKNPGKYYYVVGGDFNGTAAVSSNGFGKNDTFYVAGPHPVDENGKSNTNSGRKEHYDFVLADYPLHDFQVGTVYYSSKDSTKTKTYKNGLVFDTRLYDQSVLNEYFSPAQTGDSGASNMQHMAVVKDFLIELK